MGRGPTTRTREMNARRPPSRVVRLSTPQPPRTPPDMAPEAPPGAPQRPADLAQRLADAGAKRAGPPRTRHVREDGTPRFVNRLALESSPYLLQHANNPVDWRPWGDEAFVCLNVLDRSQPVVFSKHRCSCLLARLHRTKLSSIA